MEEEIYYGERESKGDEIKEEEDSKVGRKRSGGRDSKYQY